ncbi:MAG: hypothetical protein ACYSR0_12975 [Planctomycetota bacterium]|jgi:hypothetical protein
MNEDYIDNLFKQYMQDGEEYFSQKVIADARRKMKSCHGVDTELLHLSNYALERARFLESSAGGYCVEWRDLSFLLRKLAHRIYRECKVPSKHEGFLRLVS